MIAWRRDSTIGVGPNENQKWAHTYLGPKDVHGPWHGDRQNYTHKSQNGKSVHTHLNMAPCEWTLRFVDVVCESSGPDLHRVHIICGPLVNASVAHGGAEHSARRAENIRNGRKWRKMRTLMVGTNGAHVRLGPGCALELVSTPLCPTYVSLKPPWIWEWQGRQVSP